jgi:hypothetical protein
LHIYLTGQVSPREQKFVWRQDSWSKFL